MYSSYSQATIYGGMCFYQGFGDDDSHKWLVISAPEDFRDDPVICCNITTYEEQRAGHNDIFNDPTTIIEKHESALVTHRSCICYKGFEPPHSYLAFAGKFNQGGLEGFSRHHLDAENALLARVRLGAGRTEHILPLAIEVLKNQGIIA